MNYVLAIVAVAAVAFGLIRGAEHTAAQQSTIPATRAVVVAACATPPWTYTAGQEQPLTMNTSGQLCTI